MDSSRQASIARLAGALVIAFAVLQVGVPRGVTPPTLKGSVSGSVREVTAGLTSFVRGPWSAVFAGDSDHLFCGVPGPEQIEGLGGVEAFGIGNIAAGSDSANVLVVYVAFPENGADTTLPGYYEDFERDFTSYWDCMSVEKHHVSTTTYLRPDPQQAYAMVSRKAASEYADCGEVNNEILTRVFCDDPAESCNTAADTNRARELSNEFDGFIMVHSLCSGSGCGGMPCTAGITAADGYPAWIQNKTGMVLAQDSAYFDYDYRTLRAQTWLAAHEYGHVLGLWHTYQTTGERECCNELGHYSLMCYMPCMLYYGEETPPLHVMDLINLGWVDTTTVVGDQDLRIRDIRAGGQAYKIPLGGPEEYLVLCNHQGTEFDSVYGNSGLLIWHKRNAFWDLECASGLWQNTCSPWKQPDPVSGTDSLETNPCAHGGSGTDFFDGVAKTEFSFRARSNPNTNRYNSGGGNDNNWPQGITSWLAVDSIAPVPDTLGRNAMACRASHQPPATLNSTEINGCPGWDGDSLVVFVHAMDSNGDPIPGIPRDSIYAVNPKYCYNNGVALADSTTDMQGNTTISMLQMGRGCAYVNSLEIEVYIRGNKVSPNPTTKYWTFDLVGNDCRVTSADADEMYSMWGDGNCCIDYNHNALCGIWGYEPWEIDVEDRDLFLAHVDHPVRIECPNGGEVWTAGSQREIEWTDSDGTRNNSFVTLVISRDSGKTYADTIAKYEPNDGSYSWSIPADIEIWNSYRVKAVVYDTAGGYMAHWAEDASDNDFTITGGSWGQPACGQISADTSWSGTVYVPCDVVVAPDAELTILPGCAVRFALSDSSRAGVDTSKCELIVEGTLSADGTSDLPIVFTSATLTPASSNWRGMRLRPSSINNVIDNSVLKYAYTGIEACSTEATVTYCAVSNFTNDGIKAVASTVTITHNNIAVMDTTSRGVELTSTSTGTISDNSIIGSHTGVTYGIELNISSPSASIEVNGNWIYGFKTGIRCLGETVAEIASDSIGVDSTVAGTSGIQCLGSSAPSVRYTTIHDFRGTGVTAGDMASPFLGSTADSGSNRIIPRISSFSYYAANLTEYHMDAELNWWGVASPKSSKFCGDVDYDPCLGSDPGTHYAPPISPFLVGVSEGPYALQNYPNPFNPRTTIEYGVPESGTRVRIAIYDISGRIIRVVIDEPRPAGRFSAIWDGTNDRGGAVASGVYFSEVAIGSFRQVKKIVVLK